MEFICSKRVLIENEFIPASIGIEDGKIVKISDFGIGYNYGENYIIPGLIEIHTHGGFGYESMDCDLEKLKGWLSYLPRTGVTSLLISPYTGPIEKMKKSVDFLVRNAFGLSGSEVLGIHLEGPFLSPDHAGAMDSRYIVKPSIETFQNIVGENEAHVKLITIAPELDEDFKVSEYLSSKGIMLSSGHTGVTYGELQKKIPCNLKSFTHTYNGMLGLHHREIGTVGAALLDDRFYTEVICDGIHVSNDAAKLLFKCKPKDKIILITDSISVMGLPKGIYDLNGLLIDYNGKEAYLNGTKQLAGSTIALIDCVKNAYINCGLDLVDCINAATINPANLLGIADLKGSIEIGKHSDFCIIDDDFNIIDTILRRKIES